MYLVEQRFICENTEDYAKNIHNAFVHELAGLGTPNALELRLNPEQYDEALKKERKILFKKTGDAVDGVSGKRVLSATILFDNKETYMKRLKEFYKFPDGYTDADIDTSAHGVTYEFTSEVL